MADNELQGAAQLRAVLARSPARALEALGIALWREANDVMTDAKAETPVDEGTLRASGSVFMPQIDGMGVSVALGFGGAARAYALIQHERRDFHHTVGKDHYLSDPLNEHMAGMEGRLANTVSALSFWPGLP